MNEEAQERRRKTQIAREIAKRYTREGTGYADRLYQLAYAIEVALKDRDDAMRSKCVERLKLVAQQHREMAEKFKDEAIGEMQLIRAEECDILARSLESLTLDQVEQEKRC